MAGSPTPVEALLPESAVTAASDGQVVIFEHELTELMHYDDPSACNNAPPLAHTLVNLTDHSVMLDADERRGQALFSAEPGFPAHVAPGQSFSAAGAPGEVATVAASPAPVDALPPESAVAAASDGHPLHPLQEEDVEPGDHDGLGLGRSRNGWC